MSAVEEQIEVAAPPHAVFARWADVEGWPEFIDDLEGVRRAGEYGLIIRGRVEGEAREWTAAVTEVVPDVSVAFTGLDGPPASAVVLLEALGPSRTRVVLRVDDEGRGGERAPWRAARILARLKELVERAPSRPDPAEDVSLPQPLRLHGLGVIAAIRDLAVCDPEGERVGGVVDAYLDLGAMTVRHLAIATGALDGAHLVPADVVSWDPVWRALTVPYTREQLRGAPGAPARGELTPDAEQEAVAYFARIDAWDARRDAIARRQTPPPPTPEIGEAAGRDPADTRAPAPTPEIAEAELLGDGGPEAPPAA